MHPDWARAIRDQCAAAGVAFFFKQWGERAPIYAPCPPEPAPQTYDVVTRSDKWPDMPRVGKRAAGRLLDGVEYNAMPEKR
jgi:protein gp37